MSSAGRSLLARAAPLASPDAQRRMLAALPVVAFDDALAKGSDLDQMTEAIHVAAAIRGGSSLVHGVQMLNHVTHLGM